MSVGGRRCGPASAERGSDSSGRSHDDEHLHELAHGCLKNVRIVTSISAMAKRAARHKTDADAVLSA